MSVSPSVRRARTRITAPIAALACALLLIAGGSPVHAAPPAPGAEFYGVNTQPLVKDATIDPVRWGPYFDQLSAGAMRINRIQVSWMFVEQTAPKNGVHTYDWNYGGTNSRESVDYLMTQLARRGLRASPLFATVPSWQNPSNPYRMPSSAYPAFGAFIAAFAKRYGTGGTFWAENPQLPALPVFEYEIWTEANSTNFWTGSPNAAEYAAAMKAISPQLHAVQPNAQLLASIGWQDYARYLDAFWAAGGGDVIDGIGYHPYAPHGPAIMALVAGMRSKLAALGKPDMPIFITESGQPVAFNGPGASSAGSGLVSDAARAATHTLAADALARSDCGLQQYLIYAITGSETNKEPISEGYMGIFRHADGQPFITGAAVQRASQRWARTIESGRRPGVIRSCSGGVTADSDLLPLGLVLTKTGATCVAGVATYDGNPLEAATIEFRATGRAYGQETNAFGKNEVCLTDGPKVTSFEVFAQVKNVARSAVFVCDLPVSSCEIKKPAPDGPGTPQVTTTSQPGQLPNDPEISRPSISDVPSGPNGCTWVVQTKTKNLRKGAKRYVRVKARLGCGAETAPAGQRVRVRVFLRRTATKTPSTSKIKGTRKPKDRLVRVTRLRTFQEVTFRIPLTARRGDRLVFSTQATKPPGLPVPALRVVAPIRPAKR